MNRRGHDPMLIRVEDLRAKLGSCGCLLQRIAVRIFVRQTKAATEFLGSNSPSQHVSSQILLGQEGDGQNRSE
jgi:hypothetical protein